MGQVVTIPWTADLFTGEIWFGEPSEPRNTTPEEDARFIWSTDGSDDDLPWLPHGNR